MKFVSIRRKIIVAGVFVTVLVSTLLYFLLNFSVASNITSMELSGVRKNLIRVSNGLDNYFQYLVQKTGDWAKWDATYNFIQGKEVEEYTTQNLTTVALSTLSVNMMIYLDEKGQVVEQLGYDSGKDKLFKVSEEDLEKVIPIRERLLKRPDLDYIQGYITLKDRPPLLMVAHQILKSDGTGPAKGTFIVGRYLDDDIKKILVAHTLYPVYVQNIDDTSMPSNFQTAKEALLSGRPDYIYQAEDNDYGYALYLDYKGDPAFIVRVNVPRELVKKYLTTVNYNLFAIFAGGLLLSFMGYYFMRRYALSPLQKLHQSVLNYSKTKKDLSRLDIEGNDEIAYLAKEIKRMLENLSEAEMNFVNKNQELEKINRLMVGRELKMAELKEVIQNLKSKINNLN